MLETFCLSVLGSGGVAGIFFALIRHYIERRLMEVGGTRAGTHQI